MLGWWVGVTFFGKFLLSQRFSRSSYSTLSEFLEGLQFFTHTKGLKVSVNDQTNQCLSYHLAIMINPPDYGESLTLTFLLDFRFYELLSDLSTAL